MSHDVDGCRRICRTRGDHTRVQGECEHALVPEPTVSMSVVVRENDGTSYIAFDTYTTEGLADLIEPALKGVKIRLGPNSLTALRNGNELALTGGELRSLALEAAHAIIHRNDESPQ
jgi:hypothetical protein